MRLAHLTRRWRIATLLVIVGAAVAAWAVRAIFRASSAATVETGLGTLAAGSALLFAWATGEFRRHATSVLAAMVYGGTSITFLHYKPILFIVLIMVFGILVRAGPNPPNTVSDSAITLSVVMLAIYFVIVIGLMAVAFLPETPWLLAYPYTCAMTVWFFPGGGEFIDNLRAWRFGFMASLSMMAGAVGVALLPIVFMWGIAESLGLSDDLWREWATYLLALSAIPVHFAFVEWTLRKISRSELGG